MKLGADDDLCRALPIAKGSPERWRDNPGLVRCAAMGAAIDSVAGKCATDHQLVRILWPLYVDICYDLRDKLRDRMIIGSKSCEHSELFPECGIIDGHEVGRLTGHKFGFRVAVPYQWSVIHALMFDTTDRDVGYFAAVGRINAGGRPVIKVTAEQKPGHVLAVNDYVKHYWQSRTLGAPQLVEMGAILVGSRYGGWMQREQHQDWEVRHVFWLTERFIDTASGRSINLAGPVPYPAWHAWLTTNRRQMEQNFDVFAKVLRSFGLSSNAEEGKLWVEDFVKKYYKKSA